MIRAKVILVVALAAVVVLYRELKNVDGRNKVRMQERKGDLPRVPAIDTSKASQFHNSSAYLH
jgi:hypothetical protein